MRILVLHSRYLSGAASGENRVVDDEVRVLREADHQVEVWQPSVNGTGRLRRVKTGLDAAWSFEAAAEVRALVERRQPDVVHCHNLFPALSPAVVRAAAAAGSAVVISLHNYRLLCLSGTLLRNGKACEACLGRLPWRGVIHRCYRGSAPASGVIAGSLGLHRAARTFERVSLYLAVSRFVRRKHMEAGVPGDRIRVKPNFTWSLSRREGPGEYFLYLGRLSPEKGLSKLLAAWRGQRARLVIVGDGPEARQLKAAAPSTVEFRGVVPPSDVASFLSNARALVLPSESYEGCPRVILEAYAAGVPVIASAVGGVPELVEDGVSGLLRPPRDADAWGEAVERLLDNQEAERLGDGAWKLWSERYTPERGLESLEASYRAAMG